MRFVEVMLSDNVKSLYVKSQDCLTAGELDARNSVLRMVDFYDKVSEVFNDPGFEPETLPLPDLHEDFALPVKLVLKQWRCTRDKAKDLANAVRPKLAKMCHNYELSGAGAGQMRDEGNERYGHFDLDHCIEGDDRRSFLLNPSESWLLYWWDRLDKEDVLQFTLCILDKFQRANAEIFSLVGREHAAAAKDSASSSSPDSIKKLMATNIALVGEGVKSLSYATLSREIEAWEDKIYNLECLCDVNDDASLSDEQNKRVDRNRKRISSLSTKIEEAKKRIKLL